MTLKLWPTHTSIKQLQACLSIHNRSVMSGSSLEGELVLMMLYDKVLKGKNLQQKEA